MDCCRQRLAVLCPSIIDAGLSSSVLGEEHRALNPVTVRVPHGDLCAQPCARRGSIKPASGRRLKTEAQIGESHMGPEKFLLAATGFTRQPVGVWREGFSRL